MVAAVAAQLRIQRRRIGLSALTTYPIVTHVWCVIVRHIMRNKGRFRALFGVLSLRCTLVIAATHIVITAVRSKIGLMLALIESLLVATLRIAFGR